MTGWHERSSATGLAPTGGLYCSLHTNVYATFNYSGRQCNFISYVCQFISPISLVEIPFCRAICPVVGESLLLDCIIPTALTTCYFSYLRCLQHEHGVSVQQNGHYLGDICLSAKLTFTCSLAANSAGGKIEVFLQLCAATLQRLHCCIISNVLFLFQ